MSAKLYIPYTELELYKDLHRSGWNYVVNNLYNLDIVAKPSEGYDPADDESLILLDTYLDRTFHWDYNYLKANNKLPYTRSWIGFIHHTFSEEHTIYNSTEMFKNPDFLASLPYCKGLFTLSNALMWDTYSKILEIDENLIISNILKIRALIHPTESVPEDKLFTVDNWFNNTDKKIIHVGAWLRDMFAMYRMQNLSNIDVRKCILVGPNMENYVKNGNFDQMFHSLCNSVAVDIEQFANEEINVSQYLDPNSSNYYQHKTIHPMCRDVKYRTFGGNKFFQGIYDHISKLQSQVSLINELDNDDYDTLLANNIVYIQLFDASAINTLIECIVRHTPILINPLPAVVELLGKNYPLYFDENVQYKDISFTINRKNLQFASSFLSNIDNSGILKIEYFLDSFLNSDIIQSL